jgi:Mg2+/Co2+ transporter CorB
MIVIAIYPIIISINKIVNLLFKVLSINTQEQQTVTPQEIRSMVLDSSIFSLHYRNILLNFFDLEAISINDVMTPKSKIECININQDVEIIIKQLKTCYHNKLLVYEKNIDKPIGILHVRKTISYIEENELTTDIIRNLLTEIYYIPQHISAIKQLQYFQDRQERMGVIVDEYGEIQGLVTLEDILEQLVGEFTTSIPRLNNYTKDKDGYYVLDASINIRELNRDLKTKFDTDGAKTLNGMLIEYLQDIPDSDICVKINNVIIEITQTDEYAIKSVKLKV